MAPQPPYTASGVTETAERFRRAIGSLLNPAGGIGQVTSAYPAPLQITASTPTANLTVNAQPGEAWIPGTLSTAQGPYYCLNDAAFAINLSAGGTGWTAWTAPAAGQSQIIDIVAIVYDTDYGQAMPDSHASPWGEFNIIPVFGTAATTPSAPILPQNCIPLATFTVLNSTTAITSAMITDLRTPFALGTIPGASSPGDIKMTAAIVAPVGWLMCDGSAISRAQYSSLNSVMSAGGYPYGAGDGSTTFNVPNFNASGRFPKGGGLGQSGGNQGHSHVLSSAGFAEVTFAALASNQLLLGRANTSSWTATITNATSVTMGSTSKVQNTGASLGGNTNTNADTRPPYLGVNFIIKY